MADLGNRVAGVDGERAEGSTFNLKLEEKINTLTVGSENGYFAADESTRYENMGGDVWAFKVAGMKLGESALVTDKQNSQEVHAQTAMAVLDSSTRFIWVSEYVQSQVISVLNNQACSTAAPDTTIVCSCDSPSQFPKLTFHFNDVTSRVIEFKSHGS